MILGITAYSALLWIIGRRVPGRLRRQHRRADYRGERYKVLIIWVFYIFLAFLIIFGFVFLKYMIWGEI